MSGEQHLADARRRAEEALRRVLANAAAIVRLSWSDGATPSDRANLERIKSAAADIAQDHKILRALLAAEREAERLAEALRHCARELQYVLDADPCEHGEIHQSGEAKACVALAESLLGPMRGWPEGPNAGMLAALAEVGE